MKDDKRHNPLCPGCRKRTRSLGAITKYPGPNGEDDIYECWTEDCDYMGVEALRHHWAFFTRQHKRLVVLERAAK